MCYNYFLKEKRVYLHRRHWNRFLLAVFLAITAIVLVIGTRYKTKQYEASSFEHYNKTANLAINKLQTLIEEKKNTTLTMGLLFSQNPQFKSALTGKRDIQKTLADLSSHLREETDFKNVWIQLIDKNGNVVSRSWTTDKDDDLKKIRADVREMSFDPKISTSVSVGKYDFSIKAMVPFYDDSNNYIGYLETITHFNSIAKKMQEEGFKPLILVDKSYTKQLTHPFTKQFLDNYYVTNMDADVELLEYIAKRGVKKYIDYKQNYTIDTNGRYFVANLTLFNDKEMPMAYFLMFKDKTELSPVFLKTTNLLVNVFMFLVIIITGFFLLLLSDTKNEEFYDNRRMVKHFFLFLSIFILISSVYWTLLNLYQNSERKSYLRAYNQNVQTDYEIIYNKFKTVADMMFGTTLNNKDVLKLMHAAYTKEKDKAREQLYKTLVSEYDYFKRYDVRQLHFHLKNNESFLRFHRPEKYGDNLTGIRSTVEWVNMNNAPIEGFEEGRIYNGFRYVFPLTYISEKKEKEHVGSVEISFSAYAIAKEFASSHHEKVGFLINKGVVDSKVFDDEHSNYEQSGFADFYYEKAIKKQLEHSFIHFDIEKISQKEKTMINERISEGEIFSVLSKDGYTLFTFLPLRNPVSKKVVAFFVLQNDNSVLQKQSTLFSVLLGIGVVLILFIAIFIFREFTQKIRFLELSQKTQNILDMQQSIVIITDGNEIFDANKKFLEFFGYKTLEEFREDYECICEFFIEDDNYYHLKKVPEDRNWVTYLEEIDDKKRVVLMKDKEGQEHSFAITYNRYNEKTDILTFTDISSTMLEHFTLENKVMHDKLTGAFNREFFDTQTPKIISENHKSGSFLGLILFDIDHFKAINDTYGHNVGDYVLQELVRIVTKSIRKSDYLVRWGGEEFIVLLSVGSIDEVHKRAEHLRALVEAHRFEGIKKITCSFGFTLHLSDELIVSTVKRADDALYFSKKKGRNRVTQA